MKYLYNADVEQAKKLIDNMLFCLQWGDDYSRHGSAGYNQKVDNYKRAYDDASKKLIKTLFGDNARLVYDKDEDGQND